jgi:hypothetical protein
MKATLSAYGKNACLIHIGNGEYYIRVWLDEQNETYLDCKINHSDLLFTVLDTDAYVYEDGEGNYWIDHSPETLAKGDETEASSSSGV